MSIKTPEPYSYNIVSILKIHDGDTMTVIVDLGWSTHRVVELRLLGLDTPEVTGSSKVAGQAVRDFVIKWLSKPNGLIVKSTEIDKYGRSIAVIYNNDISLNDLLVKEKLALPYDGGSRAGTWTQDKLNYAEKRANELASK